MNVSSYMTNWSFFKAGGVQTDWEKLVHRFTPTNVIDFCLIEWHEWVLSWNSAAYCDKAFLLTEQPDICYYQYVMHLQW